VADLSKMKQEKNKLKQQWKLVQTLLTTSNTLTKLIEEMIAEINNNGVSNCK
jgi:hypothetical protein